MTASKLSDKVQLAQNALPLMFNMQRATKLYTDRFQPKKETASPEFLADLETLARDLGVSDIGYIEVPRNAIFQDKGIPHGYAIVFTVEMEQEKIESAPSTDCLNEVMRGYKNMAVIGNKLSKYLRAHGYAAAQQKLG